MRYLLRVLFTFCAGSLMLPAQDTTGVGRLVGIVGDSGGVSVPGASVCIVDTERCVETDEEGRFVITDLRSGSYVLEFSRDEATLRSESVDVRAGVDTRFEVTLPLATVFAESVTVSAPVFVAPEEVKNSNVLILGEEVWKSAGTLQDVSRYVTALPGVAGGSADFRNDIIVRGGSPLENLFIVDNIEVPNINNFANFASAGGTASIVDPILIEDVTFLTGGYPCPFHQSRVECSADRAARGEARRLWLAAHTWLPRRRHSSRRRHQRRQGLVVGLGPPQFRRHLHG